MAAIKTVLIMGAGVMGAGIAQVFAAAGMKVFLLDQNDDFLAAAKNRIKTGLDTMLDAGFYTADHAHKVRTNISYITPAKLPECAPLADFALESASENHEVKKSIFAQLDQYCRPDCILASNTSASNIFEYINVSDPGRLMIVHWFNPPYLMKLVEIVKGPDTADDRVEAVREALIAAGKKPSVLNQYVPGFIVNRIANAICREAGYMVMQGWASGEDIDAAIQLISGVRYAFEGPLRLNDVLGWDLIRTGCHDVYASLCNDADTSALAEKLVADGTLGLKSGRGVYDYTDVDRDEYMKERAAKIIKMIKAAEEL